VPVARKYWPKRNLRNLESGLGLAFWRYSMDSVKSIFVSQTGNALADRILALLRQVAPNRVSRFEINRRCLYDGQNKNHLSEALELLMHGGLIDAREVPTRGRTCVEYWALQ
jgi:hypothetical protein